MIGGDNTQAHEALKREMLIHLSGLGYFAWGNSAAVARSMDGKRIIRAGAAGQSDIFAIQPVTGRFWGVEVKTGRGKLRDKQELFRDAILRRGATFIEARCLDDLTAQHEREKAEYKF